MTWVFIGLLGFILLGGASWMIGAAWSPPLDDEMCPEGQEAGSEVVVILDVTDPWSELQREVLLTEFDRMRQTLSRFAKVHLFVVTEDEEELPNAVLSLCNPGGVEDFDAVPLVGRLGAWLFANPELLDRWQADFHTALDQVIDRVAESSPGARSPIAETIWSAGARVFEASNAEEKRIVLFSDMLQHSEAYSHYRSAVWEREDAANLARRAPAGLLRGVSVELLLVERGLDGPGTGPGRLTEFWEEWLSVQGATLIRVRRI